MARRRRPRRPHVLRHHAPRRRAVRGRPPLRAEAQPRPGPRARASPSTPRPEMEFFYFESADTPPVPLDTPAYFDLTTADMASDLRKRTILTLEAMGIPVEYSFHEDGPSQHEIDLRYTDALTMADNVMTFRLVVQARSRSELGVYATFMPKPHRRAFRARACTPTSRCSRATSTRSTTRATSTACRRSASASSPGCCTTRARSPRSPTRSVNSYKRLIAGYEAPVLRLLGPQQPSRRSCGVPVTEEGQGELDPHRVPLARPGVQPVPRVLGDARRRAQGHRGGLRPAARGHQQHLRDDRRGARRRGHRLAAAVARRGARRHGRAPSSWPRRWASTSSSGSSATSGPSGLDYKAQVTPFELDRYLGSL